MKPIHHTPRVFAQLSRTELINLIDCMKQGDAEARDKCIAFTTFESRGLWHNRARAKICRYLRTHPPSPDLQDQLVAVVSNRLTTGYFSEQFSDQLSMAIRFDPDTMEAAAEASSSDPRDYVQRYCRRVQVAIQSLRNRARGQA